MGGLVPAIRVFYAKRPERSKGSAMLRMLLAFCIVLCAFKGVGAAETPGPTDMVILTVARTIGKTNRGPLDQKRDSQLARQKIDFKSAYEFDRAMLLGQEQGA